MGWIDTMANGIKTAFNALDKYALPGIPAILLLCEINNRPGLSAMLLSSKIINELPKYGIPIGKNPDGSENKITNFVKILSNETITHLKDYAKVDGVIKTGGITFQGTGANAGGPVSVNGMNINNAELGGIIR